MKKRIRQMLAIMLILASCLSTVDIHALAEEGHDLGLLETEETTENTWDGTTTEAIYEDENFKVLFSLIGYWAGGYQADIEIENTGDSDIENWYLSFYFDHEITNIWNAEIYDHEAGAYTIKNSGWNRRIAVGECVRFGFSGSEDFAGFPDAYRLTGIMTAANDQDYTVEYHLSGDWGSGFSGTISITNNTDTTIEDWRLEFDFDRTITSIWNGEIEARDESHYIIKGAGYNNDIAPGQVVSFGFKGESGDREMEPEGYLLYCFSQENAPAFTVTFHANHADVVNAPAAQTVAEGKYAVKPDSPSREGYLFLGWYTDEDFSECFDFGNTPVNDNIDLYARWFDYLDITDTDGDGLVDSLEELIGSSVTDADTDGDGLSDLIEIDQLETSPVLYDTDGNGVSDGDEDFDGDGLSNQEELSLGTDPTVTDTDHDKLSDYEGEKIYGTDPLEADTDGDGVSDGKEIALGTDPLVYQSSFQLSVSSEHDGPVKASVDIELEGRQVETLTIEAVNNETLFPETIPGYIGEAYAFSVDGTFDTATLRFEFPAELLDTEDFDPTVYYYNETEQQLEALPTTVSSNVASAETTHFSTYILINRKIFEDEYNERNQWVDVWNAANYTGVEVVFVIDDSGSMTTYDKTYQRLKVAQNLIDNLPANSKVGIIRFTSTTSVLTTMTSDRTAAKDYLTTKYFKSSGSTYMYKAIRSGFSLFESKNDKILKMMVVLSDGISSDTAQHASVVTSANENQIKIYTVGLGSNTTYFTNYLKPLADNTGGTFYLASNADKLAEIYDNIRVRIDLETDSDSDGIADYYEDHLLLFNGVSIKTDKYNPDSDGDGLLDGQEIELRYEYNADRSQVRVTGKVHSNPLSIDSDGDGLYDYSPRVANGDVVAPADPDPLHGNGPTGFWETHVESRENGIVATQYRDDYGLEVPELSEMIKDAIGADIPNNQEIADAIVAQIVKLKEPVNDYETYIRKVALFIKLFSNGKVATIAGAYMLNFVYDTNLVAYHSQPETWQRYFGYNDFYDDVFRVGSFMNYLPYDFTVGAEKYRLWLWKGDYWNLHSGAEIGLYVLSDSYSEVDHYDAISFEVPMTLSLYNYYGANKIDNVFHWAPETEQWWITGFSGLNPRYKVPNEDVMVVVGSMNLAAHKEIYEALKNRGNDKQALELIFDDQTYTVWINWYKGVNY